MSRCDYDRADWFHVTQDRIMDYIMFIEECVVFKVTPFDLIFKLFFYNLLGEEGKFKI